MIPFIKDQNRQHLAVYPFEICFVATKVKAGNDEHKDKMMVMTVGAAGACTVGKYTRIQRSLDCSFLNYIVANTIILSLFSELYQFSSVTQLCLTLQPHGLQHASFPCPSPTPGACSNSCPLSQWCHLTISSSVFLFSSCLQSFPASGSFPMSQFFASHGQSIEVSASNEYS